MIVNMFAEATKEQIDHVVERIRSVLQECSRYFTAAGNGMNLPELRALLDRTLD